MLLLKNPFPSIRVAFLTLSSSAEASERDKGRKKSVLMMREKNRATSWMIGLLLFAPMDRVRFEKLSPLRAMIIGLDCDDQSFEDHLLVVRNRQVDLMRSEIAP